MGKGLICVLMILIIVMCGCSLKSKYDQKKNEIFNKSIVKPVCPSCPSCGEELDAVVYYFDEEIKKGLIDFIKVSDMYLYCGFVRLDDYNVSDQLILKENDLDLKVVFDHGSTMDCDAACVPYVYSQYNSLYSAGINLKLIDNLHYSFCVSDFGLFITSKSDYKKETKDYAFFVKSDGLKAIFKERFNEFYRGGK